MSSIAGIDFADAVAGELLRPRTGQRAPRPCSRSTPTCPASAGPGGFGVEEGRATGGVIALATDDTLPVRATGEVSVPLLELEAHAAIPIGKGRAGPAVRKTRCATGSSPFDYR